MEGTIGEIRMFAGNFAPRNWAFCQNQIISISQNTALFSILGTTYGGNGQTTFALPDFRGRTAVGTGAGPGLASINLGEISGAEQVTLNITQMPAHNHALLANSNDASSAKPSGKYLALAAGNTYATTTDNTLMGQQGITGGSQPFEIRNPFLGMNYIICLFGIFPSRN